MPLAEGPVLPGGHDGWRIQSLAAWISTVTDWSKLRHAYGTAEDIPDLLGQLGPDLLTQAWDDLWSRLYHQGAAYSASYAALPALTQKAREWPACDRTGPLFLAGAIVSIGDRPYRQAYAAQIAELAALAEESLLEPSLDGDLVAYVNLLQTLLAFEDAGVWGRHLDRLLAEEYEVWCPHCETRNFIVFARYGYFSTLDTMYMKGIGGEQLPLYPADPDALEGFQGRLHSRVLAAGHPDFAEKLTYVFGTAQCPACATLFPVDQAISARWDLSRGVPVKARALHRGPARSRRGSRRAVRAGIASAASGS